MHEARGSAVFRQVHAPRRASLDPNDFLLFLRARVPAIDDQIANVIADLVRFGGLSI